MEAQNIIALDVEKQSLIIRAKELSNTYNGLYSDVDIESPMSEDEKSLKAEIASCYSRINQIILIKRAKNA